MIDAKVQQKLRNKYNPEGSDLRALQMDMKNMLLYIKDICDKNEIPFWLHGGTLLGAVRHQGFIPWDDDLDIAMLRKDYLKLKKILLKTLKYPMVLQTTSTDKGYLLQFAKLRNESIPVKENEILDMYYKYHGVFVDIFPMDFGYNYFNKVVTRLIGHCRPSTKWSSIINRCRLFVGQTCLPLFTGILRIAKVIKKSNYITYDFGGPWYLNITKDDIFPLNKVSFEGVEMYAPNNTEEYLIQSFGDYMKLPPEKERATHLI